MAKQQRVPGPKKASPEQPDFKPVEFALESFLKNLKEEQRKKSKESE